MIEEGDEEMKKSETKMKYIDNGMIKAMRMVACCLLFFALAGNVFAQSDNLYVIKKTYYNGTGGEHYLAHVKVGDNYVLQDATTFSPDCLWYSGREINLSGTNHNYYFIDDANQYRFLSAPLTAGGELLLSDSKPEVYLLNNTDQNYYFYDWDYDNWPEGAGVARGHQYNGVTAETCVAEWKYEQCWEVYWVECDGSNWGLSSAYSYDITPNAGRFRFVQDHYYPMEITSNQGGLDDLVGFEMEFPDNTVHSLSASITPFYYIPAFKKYEFDEVTTPGNSPTTTHHTYYYPDDGSSNENPPTSAQAVSSGDPAQWSYEWTISGEGAEYLSFSDEGTTYVHTSSLASPTLYYRTENNTGHKTATLTLTVTYDGDSRQTTSATVTVKTRCQNPQFSADVTYEGVTVSWTATDDSYTVSWKKSDATEWSSQEVNNDNSYTITGLEYSTTYDYKVKASCTSDDPQSLQFTTLHQP